MILPWFVTLLGHPGALCGPTDRIGNALASGAIAPPPDELAPVDSWLYLTWGAALLLLGAFAACTAAALLTYSPTKIGNRLQNGRRKRILEELDNREADYQLLARGVALASLAFGLLMLEWGGAGWATWTLAGLWVGLTYGLLPGPLAERRAESVVLGLRPTLRLLYTVLSWPLVTPARLATDGVLRLCRIPMQPPVDREEIADEILAAVSDTAQDAELEDEERTWLGNIVELRDLHVSEAMTPRTDMTALADTTPLRDALQIAMQSGFSRYPVYEGKVDQVVGVFYAKDALKLFAESSDSNSSPSLDEPVRTMMRQPLFVPESTPVVDMLRQMKATKKHMAIVLDEYGGTDGIISVEDIIEEIVGDISDEYDSEQEAAIKVIEPGRVLEVSARTRVAEVNDALGCDLSDEGDFDTLGGYVLAHLGRIPKAGETFHLGGLEFHVLSGDERKLGRLRVASVVHPIVES